MSEASALLRTIAEPFEPGERIKEAIQRVARATQLSYWRTYDIYYEKARRIEETELNQIKEALRIKNEKAARNELHDLKFRIARLEAMLSASRDPDFHGPDIDFTRELLRAPGGLGGAVSKRGA